MAYFKIKYLKDGEENYKVIEARDFLDASNRFKREKIGFFMGAEEVDEPFEIKLEKLKKNFIKSLESSKIDLEEYVAVLEQMYVMLDASMSLNDILNNIGENLKNKRLKYILQTINQEVQAGLNISSSMRKFEKELGNLSISMVELGEQTGMLAEAFRDLAEILSEINENRKKLKSATRYPMFILFAMGVAFTIVILFVIPPFKSIFEQLGTELPLPTRFLLWLEQFLRNVGPWLLGSSIGMSVIINILYKKYEKVHLFMDRIMLRIYIIGSVIHFALIGRFLYSFDKMVEAGIPIMDALDTALGVVDNLYLKQKLTKIKNSIAEGRGLASGFQDAGLFEKMIVQMIRSGEDSGSLNRMLQKASNYYRGRYLNIIENISTLIEPILIAGIAGFVTMLAFGIFLPMWGMAEAVNGK